MAPRDHILHYGVMGAHDNQRHSDCALRIGEEQPQSDILDCLAVLRVCIGSGRAHILLYACLESVEAATGRH